MFEYFHSLQLPLILIGLPALVLISCKNEMSEVRGFLETENYEEFARDIEIFYTDSAIVKVRVEAPLMHTKAEGQQMTEHFSGGVFAEFFDYRGELTSWVRSENAIRNNTQKKIFLYENVVFINIGGDTLMTEELVWDEREGRVYNNRFFRFSNENEEIFGYRFSSNQEFTEYSFSRGAGFLDPDLMNAE